MASILPTREQVLDAIKLCAKQMGCSPSRSEFKAQSGMTEYQVLQYFPSWQEAVRAAGLEPDLTNVRLDDSTLLEDWGRLVRDNRAIPTVVQYRREGRHSPGVLEKHFGRWSAVPKRFLQFAEGKREWADVVSIVNAAKPRKPEVRRITELPVSISSKSVTPQYRHKKLVGVTYGEIINFRGLLHAPVNEMGVVFLFGMIADELGYKVEVVQGAFPDCKAKRRIGKNKWQDVSIEFEFESINFRDHGHSTKDCDVIVCWEHNWPDCPEDIEVLALVTEIAKLQANKGRGTNV